jgi:DNA (cytosine-5)-methyltransferase 1
VRRLTPREVARLQGFPDSFILHPNDDKAYYQLGNSVSINVVKAVAEELIMKTLYNAQQRTEKFERSRFDNFKPQTPELHLKLFQ